MTADIAPLPVRDVRGKSSNLVNKLVGGQVAPHDGPPFAAVRDVDFLTTRQVPQMPELKILAVEHDSPLRELYDSLLAARGHRVLTAETGHDALARLGPDIDVVIVDLRSHKSDGRTVLEALSREAAHRRPAIVIVDGDDESSALVTGPRTIALRKPFDFGRFVEAIEALAKTSRPKQH